MLVQRGCDFGVVKAVPEGADDEDANEDEEDDARTLAIARLPDGRRHRSFKEAVALLHETDWDAWPIAGPRTTLWCARFIADNDGTPRARHVRWRQATGLTSADPGVADHELAMRIMETALTFDQLQIAEVASVEIVMRKAQVCELKYKDKIITMDSKSQIDDDEHLYMGTGKTRGLVMVAPALEDFVAAELQRETAAAKERRKMREERAGARPPPAGRK